MGNSVSKVQDKSGLSTRQLVIAGVSTMAVSILGGVYFFGRKSKKAPQKEATSDVITATHHDSTSADESSAINKNRRQTVLFEQNDLVSTDSWVQFTDDALGLKFKHPPTISCSMDLQDSLTVISFHDNNAPDEKVLRFMTIEFQAEKVDPKEYASKALNSIRQMIPNVHEKTNRLLDFNALDAFELQYEMDMEGRKTEVWNLSISSDHVNYLFQCMNGVNKSDAIRLTKTIVSTLQISDIPPHGAIRVHTPSSLQVTLPSPYLRITSPTLLNFKKDILKATFATPDEPLVEQMHITKSHTATSIQDLLADLRNQYPTSDISDRGELKISDAIRGHILEWRDNDFEYIGFIFVHNDTGYVVKCQIEESRLTAAFQKRVVDALQTLNFLPQAPEKLLAFYVHKDFTIKAPIGTPLRELPLPLVVQWFHSSEELSPVHTNVELKELRMPIHSVDEFNDQLRRQYETPEMAHMNEVLSQKIVEVNGHKAVRMLISSVFAADPMMMMMMQQGEPNFLITMQTSFLKDSENVLSVTSVALKDEFDSNKSMFEEMHDSLTLA